MAFENFPTAASQQPAPPIAPPKTSWMAFLAGVLFFALSGAVAYIIWYRNQSADSVRDKLNVPVIMTKDSTSAREVRDLQKQLADVTQKYEVLKQLDERKDSIYTYFDREITTKRDSLIFLIQKVNLTGEQLARAKSLIFSLRGNVEGYKTQVQKLNGDKIVLTKEKLDVMQQRDQVQTNYDSARNIIRQKDDSINIGTTLSAVNFSIFGIAEKNNGKEKESIVARKVDKLRIGFEIAQNRLAESGLKDLYVCVTGPDNSPIAAEALGSGRFEQRDGSEKFYTEKLTINYIQGPPNQVISFDWRQNTNFESGDYKIEVYNNGFKIGEGIQHLK